MDLESHTKELIRESPDRIEAFNTYMKDLENDGNHSSTVFQVIPLY